MIQLSCSLTTSGKLETIFDRKKLELILRLPSSAMLGGIDGLNKGFYFMMDELPRERLGGAIEATAHLEYAFEVTLVLHTNLLGSICFFEDYKLLYTDVRNQTIGIRY